MHLSSKAPAQHGGEVTAGSAVQSCACVVLQRGVRGAGAHTAERSLVVGNLSWGW